MRQIVLSFILFFLTTIIALTYAQVEINLDKKLVKKNAKIYSLDEKNAYLLDESRFFYVSYDDFEQPVFVTLHDNNKNAIYKTSYNNIQDVEDVLNVEPNYDASVEYKKPTRYQSDDKKFEFNLRPTLTYETLSVEELSELYESELTNANGNRFEIKMIIPTDLGLDFGLVLNYQSLFWDNGDEEIQFSNISAGPYLEIPLDSFIFFNPSINIGAELSFRSIGKSALYQDKFSKTVWHLGLQNTFETRLGPMFAELFYRRHDLLLKSTDRPIDSQSKSYSLSSVGLGIGYKWDISL